MKSLRYAGVVGLFAYFGAWAALESWPTWAAQGPKDAKDLPLADLGIELVKPAKDGKTGFIVGGKNDTALIKKLTEINGITIADLERDMRPKKLSTAGFLGEKESLLEILAADNRYVVEELGLTHQELARHLRVLGALGEKGLEKPVEVLYHGRVYLVQNKKFRGFVNSPFEDGTKTNTETTVENKASGKKLSYSLLVPEMVERYGFYEGLGTKYRVDPRQIVAVLGLWEKKKGAALDRVP